jgi:protein involved in polysaccharide export with SLBB domain
MMSRFQRHLMVFAVLLLSGVPAVRAQAPDNGRALQLQAGDALRVEVKNEPHLSGQFQVNIEGMVMLPVLGMVHVADRPLERVLADLRDRYGRELADPEVLLTPLVRVVVAGEVRAPGIFLADPTLTLSHVLAMAGGPLQTANQKKIVLVRDGIESTLRMTPNAADLMDRPHSGDRLVVMRRSWVSENLPILIGAAASVAAAAATSLIVR